VTYAQHCFAYLYTKRNSRWIVPLASFLPSFQRRTEWEEMLCRQSTLCGVNFCTWEQEAEGMTVTGCGMRTRSTLLYPPHRAQLSTQAPFTPYNLLSNRLSNWFDNRLNVCIHDTTGCQCQRGCQTTNGWMFVYTIQPVVKPVVQPVSQLVVSCRPS